jgi:hypothetical protein
VSGIGITAFWNEYFRARRDDDRPAPASSRSSAGRDRTGVQPHEDLANVDHLHHIDRLTSVRFEDAPQRGELPPLAGIEVRNLPRGRQRREHALPLGQTDGSGPHRLEPFQHSSGVVPGEEPQRGVEDGVALRLCLCPGGRRS